MKPVQDISRFVIETIEIVIDAFKRPVKYFVRLVTKQPIRPALSWESIIDESFPQKTIKPDVAKRALAPESTKVNYQLAQLPQEIFDELFRRIQKNIIDEIQVIRLYEKLFFCQVEIQRSHVHFYKCTSDKKEETIDYTTLTSRLIQLFKEHQK